MLGRLFSPASAELRHIRDMTTQPTAILPQSELTAAYRAAAERQAERVRNGAALVGHKIGFTDTRRWPQQGISAPMWGAMYDDSVIDAGSGPFRYSLSAHHGPRIEPELAVRFHTKPAAGASMRELLACVDWMAHCFEIVLTPADGKPPTVPQAIANGGMHGALLLGDRRPIQELGDEPVQALEGIQVALHCDGELKEAGTSANVMGNPLNAIAQLMAGLQREGLPPIEAGDVVTTGTMTAAYSVRPGQRWTTTLAGTTLPGLDVTFE